ncbi:MAG: Crp/Fnr family transcriptional regulator [Desulfosarcinaceae bacterium]
MDQISVVLAQTPLFGGLSEEQLAPIRAIANEKKYSKGESIFLEGDQGNGFYIILDGLVKVFKVSADGKEQILHIYGPGHPIGEVPVFAGQHFPANAQAVKKSRLLFFPRRAFIDLITAQPSLALNMLAVLSEQQNRTSVDLPISKGHLASLLGTIPETLSRIFNKMTAEGIISVYGGAIAIKDSQALEALAESGKLES